MSASQPALRAPGADEIVRKLQLRVRERLAERRLRARRAIDSSDATIAAAADDPAALHAMRAFSIAVRLVVDRVASAFVRRIIWLALRPYLEGLAILVGAHAFSAWLGVNSAWSLVMRVAIAGAMGAIGLGAAIKAAAEYRTRRTAPAGKGYLVDNAYRSVAALAVVIGIASPIGFGLLALVLPALVALIHLTRLRSSLPASAARVSRRFTGVVERTLLLSSESRADGFVDALHLDRDVSRQRHHFRTLTAFPAWQPLQKPRAGDLLLQVQPSEGLGGVCWMEKRGLIPVAHNEPKSCTGLTQQLIDALSASAEVSGAFAAVSATMTPVRSAIDAASAQHGELGRIDMEIDALEGKAAAWAGLVLNEPTVAALWGTIEMIAARDVAAPSGVLLSGPPGTGKTRIAETFRTLLQARFVRVSISELKSEHVGGTERAVRMLWQGVREKAASGEPVVLFIDECDAAFPDRTGSADVFAKAITEGFLSEWQGSGNSASSVFVIGATNHKDRIDPAVLSRFGEVIEIPAPSQDARATLLSAMCEKFGVNAVISPAVVAATTGLGGRDLETIVKAAKRSVQVSQGAEATDALLAAASSLRGRSGSSPGQKMEGASSWDSLVLDPALHERLQTITFMLANSETLALQGLAPPRAMLFCGPPGTGKTHLARVLAQESRLHFESLSTAEMKAEYLGQSAHLVKDAFARARDHAPSILYLDELDVVAPARQGGSSDTLTREIVGQLLQEMDGIRADPRHVFVIASSNHAESIDAGIRSRFTEIVQVDLPAAEARRRILALVLGRKPVTEELRDGLGMLAERTTGYSGRDLEKLVMRAEQTAVGRAARSGSLVGIRITLADLTGALTVA